MKITHLQSATQIIEMGSTRILTDPWLTSGEYYGSWFHYPPFPEDRIEELEYDYLYVSHIHPDHLSEKTFRALPHKAPVLIHHYESRFLARKIQSLGFETIECLHGQPYRFPDGACLTIYAADNCDPARCLRSIGCAPIEKRYKSTQIDTLALFEHKGQSILNTNDCPFSLAKPTLISNALHRRKIDVLLTGYAGAGPYPQCFEFATKDQQLLAAETKERQFLEQARDYIETLKPRRYIPFAGTYVLGTHLAERNGQRGVPEPAAALEYLRKAVEVDSQGLVLQQGECLDVASGQTSATLLNQAPSREAYLDIIAKQPLDYEADRWDDSELEALVAAAHQRFRAKAIEVNLQSDRQVVIESDRIAFSMSASQQPVFIQPGEALSEPFVRFRVHHNLLHRLLRGPRYAHWNNAEIGSHITFLRRPDTFERSIYYCMYFFHQ